MFEDRLIFMNAVMCLGIFWGCVCRLQKTNLRIMLSVRLRYAVVGTGSLFGGLGTWMFPIPEGALIGLFLFVLSIVFIFWSDKKDWDNGPPESATKPGGLYDASGKRLD